MNVYSNPVSRCDMIEPIEIDNRQNEVEIGDVFFTTSSETPEEVGMTSVLAEKKGITYLNSFCFGFRPFEKIDKYYLAYMLRSKNTREKIILLAQGISRYNISKNKVMEISVELPSFDEQILIGKKFKLIDHLITLHQSKSFGHILKVIVSCTLSWEQRKLGDIVREVTRVDENSNAPVMMITANDGFIEQSERYSTDNAGKSLKKYILLKKWELAYNHGASKIRPFGSCVALTRATNIRIPFVYHCFLSLEDNPEFLEQTLNGKNVENQLRKIVSSGARMDGLLNISFQEYTSIFIRCPIRKEQDKISILIKSIDHLLTLHQLEPYKLIFKAIAYRIIDYAKSKPLSSIK